MSSYRTHTAIRQVSLGHSTLSFLRTLRDGFLPYEVYVIAAMAYLALC